MKKLKKDKSIKYTPLIIYKDNLNEIDMVFNDQNYKYSVEADGYSFDSIQEMLDNLKSIKKVNIQSENFKIRLQLDQSVSNLTISDYENTEAISVFYKINDILEKCKLKPYFIFKYYYLAFIYLLTLVGSTILNKTGLISNFIDYLFSAIFFFLFIYFHYRSVFSVVKFKLKDSSEKDNFFTRKKDDLILNLIILIIGVILGIIIKKYFGID